MEFKLPALKEKVPALHLLHPLEAAAVPKNPAGHEAQDEAPISEYAPTPQLEQAVAPVKEKVPKLEKTKEKVKPPGQLAQANAFKYWPAGHKEQLPQEVT